jgi:endo-1,4-beta-D-glucanase Y
MPRIKLSSIPSFLRNRKFNRRTLLKYLLPISLIIVVSSLAIGINLFRFPYYENDEGTYVSQAWAVLTQGRLAPYTYWYDHAPVGWLFIALWTFITGGFFTFGFSINSGRAMMLVLHVMSSVLLFFIGKKMTGSKWAGLIAAFIFTLSPLGLYYQRRVLLDNIMNFWLLVSLFFAVYSTGKLRYSLLSSIAFGLALLSKETAVFLLPAYFYVIAVYSHKKNRLFSLIQWLSVAGLMVSTYFIYALLKGEFFPYGSVLGGETEHVSLLETLSFQASRDGGSLFELEGSDFWRNFGEWVRDDPLITLAGFFSPYIGLIIGVKEKALRMTSLMALSAWTYLMRGGIVIEFYVLTVFPFIALNIALIVNYLIKQIGRLNKKKLSVELTRVSWILVVGVIAYSFSQKYHGIRGEFNLYTSDQTIAQIQAVEWMLERDDPDAFYAIDNYSYVDLVEGAGQEFGRAEYYWKVHYDPDIRLDVLRDNPQNIRYLALTPQMVRDTYAAGLDMIAITIENAQPVMKFWHDGWGVDIWGTNYPNQIMHRAWMSYKVRFIDNGRVKDNQGDVTHSEAQSYALLKAVQLNDQEAFNQIWAWTDEYLRTPENLFYWQYQQLGEDELPDEGTASDADQDIALALLFAHKRWGDQKYLEEAKKVISAIWEHEVFEAMGVPYLGAGNWANLPDSIVINPSYLSPAHYRIFAQVDESNPWLELVDSSYAALSACTTARLDTEVGVLPPEWCAIDKRSGLARMPNANQPRASEYAFNAFRVPWRVALDYQWYQEPKAVEYFEQLDFLDQEWRRNRRIAVSYRHNGEVWDDYESAAAYAGNLGYFLVMNPAQAGQIYRTKILDKFYEDDRMSFWEDADNYYTQNWAWFATALYGEAYVNFWKEGSLL